MLTTRRTGIIQALLLAGLVMLAPSTSTWAAIRYVDGAATGVADGTSWKNAHTTLSAALADALDGDDLWVAQGSYDSEDQGLTVSTPGLKIYGGFTNGMTDAAQRDPLANPVVVDGNMSSRCFNITATNVTLDGLTIQRGRVGHLGAGIYNTGSGLTVRSCVITNCATVPGPDDHHAGGGIYSSEPMQVLDCVVVDNVASTGGNGYGGGGIYFDSTGALLVSNTVFQGNKAQDANAGDSSYGAGGAIHVALAGELSAFNCIFDGNGVLHDEVDKDRRGGAIYLKQSSGSGRVVNCTFHGNYVARGLGGAIYSAGAPLFVTNCIFWSNTVGFRSTGGQIYSLGAVAIGYGCFPGTGADEIYADGALTIGDVIAEDPLFADAAGHDFHLRSSGGRWTPGGWVRDDVTSPCIDAGDPATPYDDEPPFNGGRINLGAYGNAGQASKSPADTAIVNGTVTYVPGQTVATLNGMLTYTGAAPAEVWVYWGKVDGTNNATGEWENTNYFGTNAAELPALHTTNVAVELNTAYYYTFKAANQYGTNWATPSAMFFTIGVPPKVTIEATDANAAELVSAPGVFTVCSDNNRMTNLPLTVYYNVGGTASNGTDYATIPSSASIPAGSTNVSFAIHPAYDTLVEGDETVTLTLVPDPQYSVAMPGAATVTIVDNPLAGSIVYVDGNASGGESDGTSWANACTSFASALGRVGAGGAIWAVRGNYTNGTEISVSRPNVAILGGFTNGMTDAAQRDPLANPVVVDGNLSSRCFNITATNVTLDGLTIQRGRVGHLGAGIYNTGSGLTVRSCVITNCATVPGPDDHHAGGGIYSSEPMQVLDCVVVDNVASTGGNGYGGGGIYFDSTGALLVSNTVFQGNKAQDANAGDSSYGAGGAIHVALAGELSAFNCIFDGNGVLHDEVDKDRRGGAIYLKQSSGSGRVVNCTFHGNYVARGLGGAIYSAGAPLFVTNCIFWSNTVGFRSTGGQIYSLGQVAIGYGCFPGTGAAEIYADGALTIGDVIVEDPLFADAAGHDFHLRSSGGRWTPGGWVRDDVTSPCVDAGDPASRYGLEPELNGWRINLGAYGNTQQASRSRAFRGTVLRLR